MNREQQLEHRLLMVADDLAAILQFINDNGLMDHFRKPTKFCDEAITHICNIAYACALDNDEVLSWRKFDEA
jgi:hypothetical protein